MNWVDWIPAALNILVYGIGQIVGHKQGSSKAAPIISPETVNTLVQTIANSFPPAAPQDVAQAQRQGTAAGAAAYAASHSAHAHPDEPTAPETPNAKDAHGPVL